MGMLRITRHSTGDSILADINRGGRMLIRTDIGLLRKSSKQYLAFPRPDGTVYYSPGLFELISDEDKRWLENEALLTANEFSKNPILARVLEQGLPFDAK